jgi:hypothetical protein
MEFISNSEDQIVEPDLLWKILAGVAREAENQQDYEQAAQYYFHSLKSAEEAFGNNDLRVAFILLECAELCCKQSNYSQTRQFLRKAKRILRQTLRPYGAKMH